MFTKRARKKLPYSRRLTLKPTASRPAGTFRVQSKPLAGRGQAGGGG